MLIVEAAVWFFTVEVLFVFIFIFFLFSVRVWNRRHGRYSAAGLWFAHEEDHNATPS